MRQRYPEPPHVALGLAFEARGDDGALPAVCELLLDRGAEPAGALELAPRGRGFEAVSDLAAVLETVEPGAGAVGQRRLRELLRGQGATHVVRVPLHLAQLGDGVVTYEPADPGEPHPVVALWSAEELGIPPSLLSSKEKKRARRRAGDLLGLFRALCEKLDPLYAPLGSEITVPAPSRLDPDRGRLGTEVFVSSRLLAAERRLEAKLRQCYAAGIVEVWSSGLFCSGWGAFNAEERSSPAPLELSRRTLDLLGETLRRLSSAAHRP